jgi:tetratricopeptide (TPR) repeat protein
MMTESTRSRLASLTPLFLLSVTFVVFGPSLGHDFLANWDDPGYVTANEAVKGITFAHLRQAFTTIYEGNYAPIQIVSYMLDHALWGMRPAGFIFTNVLLHGLNGILLYLLVLRLHGERLWALLGALLFLLHPLQVESVVWIAQRKNLLALFFSLASFHLYLTYRHREAQKKRWYAGAVATFVLALLAKAAAVVMPAILLCHDFCFRGAKPAGTRGRLLDKVPFAVAAAAIAAVTIMTQGQGEGGGRHGYPGGTPLTTLFTMLPVFVRYLGLLVWPAGLSALYPYTVRMEADATVLLSAALLGLLSVALVWLFRRNRPLAFWAIVFIICFLPVAQIVPMLTLMNDRYCYFPLVGGAPFLARAPAVLLRNGWRTRQGLCGAALVLLLLPLAWLSVERAKVWQNAVTLWEQTVQHTPTSWARYNLVNALQERALEREGAGDAEGALGYYRRILAVSPQDEMALLNTALIHVNRQQLAEARPYLLRLTTLYPTSENGFLWLGFTYRGDGDFPNAMGAYKRALEINPASVEAAKALVDVCSRLGRPAESAAYLRLVETLSRKATTGEGR